MSIFVLARFMERSEAQLGARLVGMVMADAAGDDGICWLDQSRIQRRTRLSERGVRTALRVLEGLGEVETRKAQRGRRRINVYRIWCSAQPDYDRLPFTLDKPFSGPEESVSGPADSAGGPGSRPAEDDRDDRQISANAPLTEPTENVRDLATARRARPRDPDLVWDTMAVVFGAVAPKTNAHSKRNKAVADLKRLGATPEAVVEAKRAWAELFPGTTCTDTALATHFVQLHAHVNASRRAVRPVEDELGLPPLASDEERAATVARLRGIGGDAA